jgi:hypothetical protein
MVAPVVVVRIFQKIAADGVIAINTAERKISIGASFSLKIHERKPRDVESKLLELFEKVHKNTLPLTQKQSSYIDRLF